MNESPGGKKSTDNVDYTLSARQQEKKARAEALKTHLAKSEGGMPIVEISTAEALVAALEILKQFGVKGALRSYEENVEKKIGVQTSGLSPLPSAATTDEAVNRRLAMSRGYVRGSYKTPELLEVLQAYKSRKTLVSGVLLLAVAEEYIRRIESKH